MHCLLCTPWLPPFWLRQAHAVACLFVCQKLDSVYHRLETLTHAAFRVLRQMQKRQLEPEYFCADGVGACHCLWCCWVALPHLVLDGRLPYCL